MPLGFRLESLCHGVRQVAQGLRLSGAEKQLFHGFRVQGRARCIKPGKQQVFLALERIDDEAVQDQVTMLAAQCLDHGDAGRMPADIECHGGSRRRQRLGLLQDMLTQRMGKPIQVLALGFVDGVRRVGARFRDEMVTASGDFRPGRFLQIEGECVIVERGLVAQHEMGERPEPLTYAVQLILGVIQSDAQPLVYVIVEVFQQGSTGISQPCADLGIHFGLKGAESGVDFLGRAAGLVDRENPLLEVHARFDGAEDFIRCAKDAIEEVELFRQQFQDPAVGGIALVQEINDDHVMLLAVAVATAYALLDALRVPGQIVVDDQRTELQVHPFGGGFGSQEDGGGIAEVLHQGGAEVDRPRTGDTARALVFADPGVIDGGGLGSGVAAIE